MDKIPSSRKYKSLKKIVPAAFRQRERFSTFDYGAGVVAVGVTGVFVIVGVDGVFVIVGVAEGAAVVTVTVGVALGAAVVFVAVGGCGADDAL